MRKTRLSPEEIDRALRLAQAGVEREAIEEALGIEPHAETREVQAIAPKAIQAIARDLFGSRSEVARIEALGPLETHGIERRGGFTGNLVYRVELRGEARAYAFRFNRGLREALYDEEAGRYREVEAATGVPGPELLRIDRSRRLAPTEYMVMVFAEGERWSYLAHPDNPETSPAEKARLRAQAGAFYARLHRGRRAPRDAGTERRQLLFGLYRLRDAVEAGSLTLAPGHLEACLRALAGDPRLDCAELALCFADAELCCTRREGAWEPAFVCDLEWVGYRDPCADLVGQLVPGRAMWQLDAPLVLEAGEEPREDPFFRAYDGPRQLDWTRLRRLPPYYQLSLWGHALADQGHPTRAAALVRARGGVIRALVELVAGRAP